MKLEELYPALQNRYPIEREKKVAMEKKYKEDLKKEILTIIHYAKYALENTYEKVYKTYERIIDQLYKNGISKEEMNAESTLILFKLCEDYIDYSMKIGSEEIFITSFMVKQDISKNLKNVLARAYYIGNKEKPFVHFNEHLLFNLTENTIKLYFYANTGDFNDEEQTIIKKFISDLKEIFQNSEISQSYCYVDLVLKFEYFESEYDRLVRSPDVQRIVAEPISNLHLSARAYNSLYSNNIRIIEDLVQLSEQEIRDMKNIGYRTFNEIKCKLEELSLHLLP